MKHQHHRGASTCSTNPITKTSMDSYLPLHRSITDDHDDKHSKHHYDNSKSPITRFVCKLLGLDSSKYKKRPHFGNKSNSTTSITKSSVFHFSSIPIPSTSSTLSEHQQQQQQQQQHVNGMHSCYSHKKKKVPIATKKKKKKNGEDASCSNNSSSTTLSSLSSSTISSSSLSSDPNNNNNITTRISDSIDHNNPALESTNSTCTSTSSLISDDDKKFPGKSNNGWVMVTPAMDALVIASQIPSVKKTIHFVDDFDILPPILTNRDPSTYPLLTGLLSEQLRPYLPRRYRLASEWNLLYSLDQHGASLSTLYHRVMDSGPCIIVLRDDENQVFGAFLNESLRVDLSYYGTGECFLWKISPPATTTTTTNNTSSSSVGSASSRKHHHHHPTPKIKVFPWTGKNEYMIYSTIDCIAIGGGEGKFGLWLNQDLENGHSEPCATFDNECLSLNPLFTCIDLEIWSFRI